MVRQMSDLLKELGWTDGFRIPVADKNNKVLEIQVEELFKEKADLLINLESHKESVAALQRQFDNYKEEEAENQQMLITRQNQMEMEFTRLKLSESEQSKLIREISEAEKKLREYETKHAAVQCEIDKMMTKLNALKSTVGWGEEALLSWNEIVAKGADETELIERFCLEDRKRFEDLVVQRKRLATEIAERREILDSIINDKMSAEFQMQQCAKLFRRAVHDYRVYMGYWNTSIHFMRERDSKIEDLFKEICDIKKSAILKYDELRDRLKFRDLQKKNNAEMVQVLRELGEKIRVVKETLNKVTDENNNLATQRSLIQSQLSQLGLKLTEQRSVTSVNSAKLECKSSILMKTLDARQVFNCQFEKLCGENISQSERNGQLDAIRKELEKSYKLVKKDAEKLKAMLSNQINECKKCYDEADLRATEVRHRMTSCSTLDRNIKEIERLIQHHREILYNNRYTLVKLMSKVAKLEGEGEDMFAKEKFFLRVRELEGILKEKMESFTLISGQVKHSEEDLRRINIEVEKGCLELHHLIDARQDRAMTVEGGRKKLQNLKEINQQLQVEQNVLRLQVDQVEKNVAKQEDGVYNLEKQRLELEAAMRERRIEIQAQRDILSAKRKTLQEERSELKRSVEHLNSKILQVQKRFEIAMDLLGTNSDYDESATTSITQCKIKIAQEKNELQEKGDNLDAKIRKSEKEILAMENTLRLINCTNRSYKLNLCSVDEDSPEMAEKHQLENNYLTSTRQLKKQQNTLKTVNESIKELENSLVSTVDMEEKLQNEWKAKDKEARDLDKELSEQQPKLHRAEKQFKKITKQVHAIREPQIPIKLAEKDMETRELKDVINSAIQQLADITVQYIETGPVINRYLGEKGLSLARRRSTVKSWKSGSTVSLTPSVFSEVTTGSGGTSITPSEHSVPSIVNLDPFGRDVAPPVHVSSGTSFGSKKSSLKTKKSNK